MVARDRVVESALRCAAVTDRAIRRALVLDGTEATVFGPLYARANDVARPVPLLGDRRARMLVEHLDYDFSRFHARSMLGPVVRTLVFDQVTRALVREHPCATVVELGAGLNTRFERLDNGRLRWFDIDLPNVTRLRRRLLPVSGRRMHVPASLLDDGWLDLVATTVGPHCFLFEAVLGYIPCREVRPLLAKIARRFPASEIVFDVHPRWAIDGEGELRELAAPPAFGIDIPRVIAGWELGLELVEMISFLGRTPRPPGRLRLDAWRAGWMGRSLVVARFRARATGSSP